MAHDHNGDFFGFILGGLMAAMICGVMLFATGNFVTNSPNTMLRGSVISADK